MQPDPAYTRPVLQRPKRRTTHSPVVARGDRFFSGLGAIGAYLSSPLCVMISRMLEGGLQVVIAELAVSKCEEHGAKVPAQRPMRNDQSNAIKSEISASTEPPV